MTPAERQLVADLFDRLATLEDAQRDPDAERAIRDGLRQAPNAVYALVQTTLVQDEALKNAQARIEELEAGAGEPPRPGGFLDNMRDSIFGRRDEQRGSVPTVKPGGAPMGAPPGYERGPMGAPSGYGGGPMGGAPGYGAGYQQQPEPGRGGGSFLGTAAAAAAGVIGGSLLLNSIRSMTGGGQQSGLGLSDPAAAAGRDNPWGEKAGGNSDLARDAGINDIGRGSGEGPFGAQGLFDSASDEPVPDDAFDAGEDMGGFDSGGGGGGD